MDGEAWWATVHRVAKSRTRVSDSHTHTLCARDRHVSSFYTDKVTYSVNTVTLRNRHVSSHFTVEETNSEDRWFAQVYTHTGRARILNLSLFDSKFRSFSTIFQLPQHWRKGAHDVMCSDKQRNGPPQQG